MQDQPVTGIDRTADLPGRKPENSIRHKGAFDTTAGRPWPILARITSSGTGDDPEEGRPNVGLVTKTKPKTKRPSLYKVLMLNDDYTPMEFVIHVLEQHFSKTREEATQIMLHVHTRGVGVCGIYTYEVAETKTTQVMDIARREGHPLQCTLEKE